jgi:chromosome segregation ATPase
MKTTYETYLKKYILPCKCLGLDVRIEEIAERYTEIDQEIYEMLEWYERVKKERKKMEERLKRVDRDLRYLNNDVQSLKLQAFSRVQHGGLYSRVYQNRRP